ncbi:RNA-directed DNA polymerase, eukaryota, reverse transcriptase zinc-binding domain protein [Tanacetum coccineum]
MVNWIMVCVSTTKFSININGEREGYFSGGRGLRQGDPMSTYLITLIMEITHLCFADDLLVFCHGDIKSVSTIKEALEEFSNYSGLKANMSKSTVFFGGLNVGEQTSILNIQRISLTGFPAQSVGSSNTDVLDSPCLLVLITGTSQSRQHVITSLIHIESCKSPTKSLFDVGSSRISIFTVNT